MTTTTLATAVNLPGPHDRREAIVSGVDAATLALEEEATRRGASILWDTATVTTERATVESHTITGTIRMLPGRQTVIITVVATLPAPETETTP